MSKVQDQIKSARLLFGFVSFNLIHCWLSNASSMHIVFDTSLITLALYVFFFSFRFTTFIHHRRWKIFIENTIEGNEALPILIFASKRIKRLKYSDRFEVC